MWTLSGHVVDGCYDVLYADPPWSYRDKAPKGGAEEQYQTVSLADLCKMPIGALGKPDSVLFMWATWPTLPDALTLMQAWGYEFKNCAYLWAKINKKAPTPFFGLGHWTRGNTEPCLLGVRGKPHRVDAKVEQLLCDDNLVAAKLARHSEKPNEVRERILKLMGPQSFAVELFARKQFEGWDSFGNELPPETSLQLK